MPRHREMPDVTAFDALVAEALEAYGLDVSYAVQMASTAKNIIGKRRTWDARTFVRAAEVAARATCRAATPFPCDSQSACGTGSCRFSHDQLVDVVPEAGARTGRPSTRVQLDSAGLPTTYILERAVFAFRDRDKDEPGADAA